MKYIVTINDKDYEVEVEKGSAQVLKVTTSTAKNEASPLQAQAPAVPVSTTASTPVPPAQKAAAGSEVIVAPMPGVIVDILKEVGSSVKCGETVLTLEAMKMENEIMAPKDGTVVQVLTTKGATVTTGTPLIEIQ
jgi:biotin carboxyl carrier protein